MAANLTTADLHERYMALMAQHRSRANSRDWSAFDLAMQLNEWMVPCFAQRDLPPWEGLPLDLPEAAQLPLPDMERALTAISISYAIEAEDAYLAAKYGGGRYE